MLLAAENLDFEKAARIRDQIRAAEGGGAVQPASTPMKKASAGKGAGSKPGTRGGASPRSSASRSAPSGRARGRR